MEERPVKRKKKIGPGTGLLCVLAVLLLAAAVLAGLVFSGPGEVVATVAATDQDVVQKLKAAVTTGELRLSAGEITALTRPALEKTQGPVGWKSLELRFEADGSVTGRVPVAVAGRQVPITAKLLLGRGLDGPTAEVTELYAGKLPLDPAWALGFVKDKFPEQLKLEGRTLTLPAKIETKLGNTGLTFSAKIQELKVDGPAGEVVLTMKEYSLDGVSDLLSRLFGPS